MYDFTTEDVVREVRRLAEEEPDFVYTAQEGFDPDSPSCYYASADGRGSGVGCIVGQALERLGVSQEALRGLDNLEGATAECVIPTIIPTPSGDEGVLDWLRFVQANQDMGLRWYDAVKLAGERMEDAYGSN